MQADSQMSKDRQVFYDASLQYVFKIQEVQERKKFEFVEPVNTCVWIMILFTCTCSKFQPWILILAYISFEIHVFWGVFCPPQSLSGLLDFPISDPWSLIIGKYVWLFDCSLFFNQFCKYNILLEPISIDHVCK